MNPFTAQGLLKGDPPRFGRGDEAKIPYEENPLLKDRLLLNTLKLARKPIGEKVSEVGGQGGGADGGRS